MEEYKEQSTDKYDRLFQRISSSESRKAADQLFELTDDQLNNGFKSTEPENTKATK